MLEVLYRGRLSGLRFVILLAAVALVGIGLATIYAATGSSGGLLRTAWLQQLKWLLISLAGFFAVHLVHYRYLARISYLLYSFSLLLLVLVLVGKYAGLSTLVPTINGSCRWLDLGPLRLQPSELTKLAYILVLAWHLRRGDRLRTWGDIGPLFCIALVPMVLIIKQPDLGTVLLFIPVLFAVLFAAGAQVKHLALIIAAGVLLSPLLYYFGMKPYQRERIAVLLNQGSEDPYWLRGPGYQLHESKIWIGSGGLTGQGWRQGEVITHRMLPHHHNDFIFSLIAHQWGLVGALAVLGLYMVIFVGGIEIAAHQSDAQGRVLAVGVTALFAAQMFTNVGVTVGLMPVTGMTLPFVSYGGSSLLTNFLALGLLFNTARYRPHHLAGQAFEEEEAKVIQR